MLRFEPCGASLALPGLTPQVPAPCGIPCHSASWSLSCPSPACPCIFCEPPSHIAAVSLFRIQVRWILDTTYYLASSGTVGGSCHRHQPTPTQTLWDSAHCRGQTKGTKGWQLCTKKAQVLWNLWWEWDFVSLSCFLTALFFQAGDQSNTAQSVRSPTQFSVELSFEQEEWW